MKRKSTIPEVSQIRIMSTNADVKQRMEAIVALCRACEEAAKALNAPQVMVTGCVFNGVGATLERS